METNRWNASIGGAAGLSDSDQRMVALGVSLASGLLVDLAATIAVSGPAHARRVIEAVAIATGYSDRYAVTPKPHEEPVRRAHA